MIGIGTLVNSIAIVGGATIGLLIKRGLPAKWQETIMNGIGLSILVIGIQMALKTNQIVLVIVSLSIGGIIGEFIDIEEKLNKLGEYIGRSVGGNNKSSASQIVKVLLMPQFFTVVELWL